MAAPAKPWESVPPCCRPGNVNSRMVTSEELQATPAPQLQSTLAGGGGVLPGPAPPIPALPGAELPSYGGSYTPYGGMTPYGAGFGGLGGVGYGNYGSYGSYGGYGRPGPETWFVRAAEESTRGTFESIESVVRVFTSISQMMESTYMLVHSSFRAVVGVAEQVSTLRQHLAQLVSAFSVLRLLRWCLRFLRRWLGYPELEGAESAWAAAAGPSAVPGAPAPPPRWPALVYAAAVLGAPYLAYRLLQAQGGLPGSQSATDSWMAGDGEHFSAVASHDFTARGPSELSVRAGQAVRLAPRRLQPGMRGWVLASDGASAAGLVPASYVKIRGLVPEGGAAAAPQGGAAAAAAAPQGGAAAATATPQGSTADKYPAPAAPEASGCVSSSTRANTSIPATPKTGGGCCGGAKQDRGGSAPAGPQAGGPIVSSS